MNVAKDLDLLLITTYQILSVRRHSLSSQEFEVLLRSFLRRLAGGSSSLLILDLREVEDRFLKIDNRIFLVVILYLFYDALIF